MKATRWPALLVLPLFVLGLVVLERSDEPGSDVPPPSEEPGRSPDPMPIAAPSEAFTSRSKIVSAAALFGDPTETA